MLRAIGFAAALVAGANGAAASLYLSESGGIARVSGIFEAADVARFDQFLKQRRSVPLSVIYLDSSGGEVTAGIAIGRLIRKARLVTAVDAARARCDSACTLIFAGGIRRHYMAGDRILDGFSSLGGLGFHPAHQRDPAWTRAELSDKGTRMMATHYRAMGMPGAAEMMRRAGFSSMYRPSGATALRLGIATSLVAP